MIKILSFSKMVFFTKNEIRLRYGFGETSPSTLCYTEINKNWWRMGKQKTVDRIQDTGHRRERALQSNKK
jgi:hypothetical protein